MSDYPRPMPETAPEERPPEVVRVELEPGRVRQVALPADLKGGRAVHYELTLEEVPGQPGLWREVKRVHRPLIKLTDDMAGPLHGTGLSRRDVLVWAYAGFIRAYRPGLHTTLVDPATVWQHIYRCRLGQDGGEAADFWADRARIRDYSEASQEVMSRGLVARETYKEACDAQGMLNLE